MVDVIRTLDELNALFPDNVNGEIAPSSIRDLFQSLMVHAEIQSGAKASITLGNGYQPLDLNVAGSIGRGLTVDTTNKWIAGVPVQMKADVTLEVLFRGANGTTYEFTAFRNPDSFPVQITRLDCAARITAAADIRCLSVSAAIQLQQGDKIQAGVRANGAAFELLRANLKVRRLTIE